MTKNSELKIVLFATPDFILPVAKELSESFDLVGVVTSPDSPMGRKKTMTPSPIKSWYMEYLLEKNREGVILTPSELSEDVTIRLRKLHPDLFVVAAYGKLVPESILSIPKLGAINIHPSLLPKFRGPSPIQNALLNGDEKLGITIMKMDEELDHGPILKQWEVPIEKDDTFASLHIKSFTDAAKNLAQIVTDYSEGRLSPQEQDHAQATFCQKISKEDGFVDLDNPPDREKLQRMIKAYYPWPGVWTKTKIQNKELRIKFLPEKNIQIEGGKITKISELLNGHPELKPLIEKLGLH